ncbi:TVP38/TMEM64 family protein [Paenibacillus rhizoplanae]
MIAFYFTRFLGGTLIEGLLKRDKFKWMRGMMDNNKFSVFLFIIFIIPGLPKDMFIYAAGLTTIKPLRFFTILLIARLPWLLASVSIGANIYHKNYGPTIIISAISVLAFILGLIYKDKLIHRLTAFKGGKKRAVGATCRNDVCKLDIEWYYRRRCIWLSNLVLLWRRLLLSVWLHS